MSLYTSVTGDFSQLAKAKATARKERIVSKFFMNDFYGQGKIEVVYVTSSNLVCAGYNPNTQVLQIEFRRYVKGVGNVAGGGARYEYAGVTPAMWNTFKLVGSKGKWVWNILRKRGIPYRRIR